MIQKCAVQCLMVAIFLAVTYTAQTENLNGVSNMESNFSFDSTPVFLNTKSPSRPDRASNLDHDPSSDVQLINTSRRSYRFESLRQNLPVSNRRAPNPWVRIDNTNQRGVEYGSQSNNRTAGPLSRDKQQLPNFWQTGTPENNAKVEDVWKSDINVDFNSPFDNKASGIKRTDYKTVLTSSLKNTTSEIDSPTATNHSENQGYVFWTAGNGDGTSGWKLENIGGVARWTTTNDNGAGGTDTGAKESYVNLDYDDTSSPVTADTNNDVQSQSFEWVDRNDTIFVDKEGNLLKSWRVVGKGGQDGWQVIDNNGAVEWNIVYEDGEWKVVSTQEYNPITWLLPKQIDPSIIKDLETANETADFPYTKWDDGQTEYYVYQVEDNSDYRDYPWDEGNRNWQYPSNPNFYVTQDWTTEGSPNPVPEGTGAEGSDQEKKYGKNDTVNESQLSADGKAGSLQQTEVPPSLQRKSDTPYKEWGTQKSDGLNAVDLQRQGDLEKSKNSDEGKQVNVVYNVAIPIEDAPVGTGYVQPQYYSNDNFPYQEWVNQYDDKGTPVYKTQKNTDPVYSNIYPTGYTKNPAGGSINITQSPQYVKASTNVSTIPENTNVQWPKSGSTQKSDVQVISDNAASVYNRPYPAVFVLNSKDTPNESWAPPVLYGEQVQRYNTNSWKGGNGWKTGYGSQVWIIDGLDELPANKTTVDDSGKKVPEKPKQVNANVPQHNATGVSEQPVREKTNTKSIPQTKTVQFPEKPIVSGSTDSWKGNQSVISGWVNGYGVKTWTTTDSGVSKWSDERKTYGFGNNPQKGIINGANKTANNGKNLNKGTPFTNNRPANKRNWLWPTVTPQQNISQPEKSTNSKVPYSTDSKSSDRGSSLPTDDGTNPDRIYDGPITGSKVFWLINENGMGIPAVWQQDYPTKRWQNQSRGDKDSSRYGSDNGGIPIDSDNVRKSPKKNEPQQPFIPSNKGTNRTRNSIWKRDGGNSDSFSGWRPIIIINSNQQTGIPSANSWDRKGPQTVINTWNRTDNKPTQTPAGGEVGNSAKNPDRLWVPNGAVTSRPRLYKENRRGDDRITYSTSAPPESWKTYGYPPVLWKQSGQKSWNAPPVQSNGNRDGDKFGGWKDGNVGIPLQQPGQNEEGNPIRERPVDRTDTWKSVPQQSNVQGNAWKPNGNSNGWIPLTGPKSWGVPSNRRGTGTANPDCDKTDKKTDDNTDMPKDKPKGMIIYDKSYPDYNPQIPAQLIIITKLPDNVPWKPGSAGGENRNLSTPGDKGSNSGSPGDDANPKQPDDGKTKPVWPPRNNKGSSGKSWGNSPWPTMGKSWNYVPPKRSGSSGPAMWVQNRKDDMKPNRQQSTTNGGWVTPYESLKKWKTKQREKLANLLTSPSRSSYNWKRNMKRWLG